MQRTSNWTTAVSRFKRLSPPLGVRAYDMSERRNISLPEHAGSFARLCSRPGPRVREGSSRTGPWLRVCAVVAACAFLVSCASIMQVLDSDDRPSTAATGKAGPQKRIPRPPTVDDFERN